MPFPALGEFSELLNRTEFPELKLSLIVCRFGLFELSFAFFIGAFGLWHFAFFGTQKQKEPQIAVGF